jgi:hypothetical protein
LDIWVNTKFNALVLAVFITAFRYIFAAFLAAKIASKKDSWCSHRNILCVNTVSSLSIYMCLLMFGYANINIIK